jgi:hypothetical protein
MPVRLTMEDLNGMTPRQTSFLIDYMSDFNIRRACEKHGMSPKTAALWLKEGPVHVAMAAILCRRQKYSDINAEWHLLEAVDLYSISKQEGKLSTAATTLRMIGQHAAVDSFAAEKVQIDSADAVRERLDRAKIRNRAKKLELEAPRSNVIDVPEPLDFMSPMEA